MLDDHRTLLSQQELTGTGDLYRGDQYLGKCEYRLKTRRSRLVIPKYAREQEYLITTIIGELSPCDQPIDACRQKHPALILHLNDDYLLPLTASPDPDSPHACKVYGRLVNRLH